MLTGLVVSPESMSKGVIIADNLQSAIGFVILVLHSFSALRHAFYETFLHLHIFLVIVALGFLWVHVRHYGQLKFLQAAIIAWSLEVSYPLQHDVVTRLLSLCSGDPGLSVLSIEMSEKGVRQQQSRPFRVKPCESP